VELLAYHCAEAGLTEPAVVYWLAAGRQAWNHSALAEAVALLRRGLALVPALPDSDRRREVEFDLQVALGQALIASRGWSAPELAEAHCRVRELASTLNRPRALLIALWGQFMDRWTQADLEGARRLAVELRELGDKASDIPMQVLGCNCAGLTYFCVGEFVAGRAQLEKAFALYDPAHRPYYAEVLPHDARVHLQRHSAWLLACLGHLDQAWLQCEAALEQARRLSHPPTLTFALVTAWVIGWFVGLEVGSLFQYADETLELATENGLGAYRTLALILRGWSLAALGRTDEGIPLLSDGLAGYHELGAVVLRPWGRTLLGDACRMAGRWQAALEHLVEARRLAEETRDRWCQAETLRLSGDVLLAIGDSTAAEASYREAVVIAQSQNAKLWELRAAMSLARLWRDQRKRTEAHELLAPVYGWFTEGLGTPVLQGAKALLEEVAA
jgi:predicted ATPase